MRVILMQKKQTQAKQVRDLRTKLGLTQEQFAAEVGVTWSTVNRWENERGKPSPLARQRIQELYGKLKNK